mmetsp:Transcript_33606/g.81281  ORF Transcript_33606/g.81281 Transcript_33606/m.81281 type:complete len:257 (+) Transcript_33606:466-1236(+)
MSSRCEARNSAYKASVRTSAAVILRCLGRSSSLSSVLEELRTSSAPRESPFSVHRNSPTNPARSISSEVCWLASEWDSLSSWLTRSLSSQKLPSSSCLRCSVHSQAPSSNLALADSSAASCSSMYTRNCSISKLTTSVDTLACVRSILASAMRKSPTRAMISAERSSPPAALQEPATWSPISIARLYARAMTKHCPWLVSLRLYAKCSTSAARKRNSHLSRWTGSGSNSSKNAIDELTSLSAPHGCVDRLVSSMSW